MTKKHKEPKDPRIAVWKKDVKALKSKDAAVRQAALAKCSDVVFLELGHGLAPFMKMLTMAKKSQHDMLMDAVGAFRGIVAPAEVDGALPEGAAEAAAAVGTLVLRGGLGEHAAWHGAGALVKLFEDKRPDVSELALGTFADFANLAAALGPGEELDACRSSLCSAGDPAKKLAHFLHNALAKKPKPKRSPEQKLLALRALVALVGACPDGAALAALVGSGALGSAMQLLKKEQGTALGSAALHLLLAASACAAGRAAIAKGGGVPKLLPQVDAEVSPPAPAPAKLAEGGEEEEAAAAAPAPEPSAPALQRAAQLLARMLCLPLTDEPAEDGAEDEPAEDEAAVKSASDAAERVLQMLRWAVARLPGAAADGNSAEAEADGEAADAASANAAAADNGSVLALLGSACEALCRLVREAAGAASGDALRTSLCEKGLLSVLLSALCCTSAPADGASQLRLCVEKALHEMCVDAAGAVDARVLGGGGGDDDGAAPYLSAADLAALAGGGAEEGGEAGEEAAAGAAGVSTADDDARKRGLRLAALLMTDAGSAALLAGTSLPTALLPHLVFGEGAASAASGGALSAPLVAVHAAKCLASAVGAAASVAMEPAISGGSGAGAGEGGEEEGGATNADDSSGAVPLLLALLSAGASEENAQQVLLAPRDDAWPAQDADPVFDVRAAEPGSISLRAVAADTLAALELANESIAARLAEQTPMLLAALSATQHPEFRLSLLQVLAPLPLSDARRTRQLEVLGWTPPPPAASEEELAAAAAAAEEEAKAKAAAEKKDKKGSKKDKKDKKGKKDKKAEPEPEAAEAPPAAVEEAAAADGEEASVGGADFESVREANAAPFDALVQPLLTVMRADDAPGTHVYAAARVLCALCCARDVPAPPAEAGEGEGETADAPSLAAELISSFAVARGALPTLAALLDAGPLGGSAGDDTLAVVQDSLLELTSRVRGRTWLSDQAAAPVPLLDVSIDFVRYDLCAATALFCASRGGALDAVQALLGAGANPNTPDARSLTPLMAALALGDDSLVRALLEGGADADTVDSGGSSALKYAFARSQGASWSQGTADAVGAAAATSSAVDANGESALSMLLAAGADPNVADDNGDFPLHWACAGTALQTRLRFLDVELRLCPAAERSDSGAVARVVETLLASGADTAVCNMQGRTPLHTALQHGVPAAAKLLLQSGAFPNVRDGDGSLPVHVACGAAWDGASAVAGELLSAGDGKAIRTAAHSNARRGKARHEKVAQELDAVFDEGLSELLLPRAVAEEAVAASALMNARGAEGMTLLDCAAKAGSLATIYWLLGKADIMGASVVAPVEGARNALHFASSAGGESVGLVVDALLGAGVDPAAVAAGVGTPLHAAVRAANEAVAARLLGAGVSPWLATEDHGQHILKNAVEAGCSAELVGKLAGCDGRPDGALESALQAAAVAGASDEAVVEALVAAGADCAAADAKVSGGAMPSADCEFVASSVA